jgi:hypothetical protein
MSQTGRGGTKLESSNQVEDPPWRVRMSNVRMSK